MEFGVGTPVSRASKIFSETTFHETFRMERNANTREKNLWNEMQIPEKKTLFGKI